MAQLSLPISDPDSLTLAARNVLGAAKRLAKLQASNALSHAPVAVNVACRAIKKYRYTFGRYPNVLAPRTFNEKIQARKIFDRRRIFSVWADKALARSFVGDRLGHSLLPRLYWLTADPGNIPFDLLPRRYVVKATHGSGWVWVVKDGATVDRDALVATCRDWLRTNYYDLNQEPLYRKVTPRIIIEEFLDNGQGEVPDDFKFYVFGGTVRFIQIDLARFGEHRRAIYDRNWNLVPVQLTVQRYCGIVGRPTRLEEMIRVAEALAGDIDFVRVDLYEAAGRVYFGEMTPSSGNGFNKFTPEIYDDIFGSFWQSQRKLTPKPRPAALLAQHVGARLARTATRGQLTQPAL